MSFIWLKRQLDEPSGVGWTLGQPLHASARRKVHVAIVPCAGISTPLTMWLCLQVVSLLAVAELEDGKSGHPIADAFKTRDMREVNEHATTVRVEKPEYELPLPGSNRYSSWTKVRSVRIHARSRSPTRRICRDRTGPRCGPQFRPVLRDGRCQSVPAALSMRRNSRSEPVVDELVHRGVTEAIVDAFAPWYRVEPKFAAFAKVEDPKACAKVLHRLDQAARHPIYTLVSTEVLAEGVNLQECGVVLHFDLPWNPTRLIQRNGRVDRRISKDYEMPPLRKKVWGISFGSLNRNGMVRRRSVLLFTRHYRCIT